MSKLALDEMLVIPFSDDRDPQGQCLSPHLYAIFTADMPTTIKHEIVDMRKQLLQSLQWCLDNLQVYCTGKLPKVVNVSTTTIVN